MDKLVVIAIGGNSLIKDAAHSTVFDQYRAAGETSDHIARIVAEGYRVVITHGNGPQVGFILLRSEMAKEVLHEVPLDTCGADTQGAIGYQICQTLRNELQRDGLDRRVAAVVTQVVVDAGDPGFQEPSKPIGPFYSEEVAQVYQSDEGWEMKEDAGRGWRRVVASPKPLEIVEETAIRTLLEEGIIVVAVGGGGIPVVRDAEGYLEGVAAVIDKDWASCLLAKNLGAEIFMISTAVDKVAIHFGTPEQRSLDEIGVSEAKRYHAEGHFPPGSMGPKMEAAIDFLEHGGKRVIITQPHLLEAAMRGETGTHIVP
jgi:carbamate kinase